MLFSEMDGVKVGCEFVHTCFVCLFVFCPPRCVCVGGGGGGRRVAGGQREGGD